MHACPPYATPYAKRMRLQHGCPCIPVSTESEVQKSCALQHCTSASYSQSCAFLVEDIADHLRPGWLSQIIDLGEGYLSLAPQKFECTFGTILSYATETQLAPNVTQGAHKHDPSKESRLSGQPQSPHAQRTDRQMHWL